MVAFGSFAKSSEWVMIWYSHSSNSLIGGLAWFGIFPGSRQATIPFIGICQDSKKPGQTTNWSLGELLQPFVTDGLGKHVGKCEVLSSPFRRLTACTIDHNQAES